MLFICFSLEDFNAFSRPQQDDWMVPQCRFICIQTHPLALIVPGHPWGVNPLCVSSWVGSGDALLLSIPSIYSNVSHAPCLPDTSTTGSEFSRGQWSFFLGFCLQKCWDHQESPESAPVLLQVLGCTPGLVVNIEGRGEDFCRGAWAHLLDSHKEAGALGSVGCAGNCSAGVICPVCEPHLPWRGSHKTLVVSGMWFLLAAIFLDEADMICTMPSKKDADSSVCSDYIKLLWKCMRQCENWSLGLLLDP